MDFTRVTSNLDGCTEVAIVPIGERGLRDVLSELELTAYNRRRREWSLYRFDGRICIGVPVDCGCEHDCCGHVCGLSYELIRRTSDWVIIAEIRRNV